MPGTIFCGKPYNRGMKHIGFRLGLLAAALAIFPAAQAADLMPGKKAPEIKSALWVKGKPFKSFSESEFTVVEFWATWCGPCIDAIPHVTELAKKHKGKVAFYGMNVWEGEGDVTPQVKEFVSKMGAKMDYNVGMDTKEGHMAEKWMTAANQNGIPASFVINKEGTVLWIGHPMDLEGVLDQAISGKFDLQKSIKDFETAEAKQAKFEEFAAKIDEAVTLYASGKKEEGLKKLEAIDDEGDEQMKAMKENAKVQMFFPFIDELTAYVDSLIKEGKAENGSKLVELSFMLKKEHSDKHKALVARAIDEGVKLDSKNPITFLMAGYGWSILGDNKKANAMADEGLKVLPTSTYKDDKGLQEAFAELKEKTKG